VRLRRRRRGRLNRIERRKSRPRSHRREPHLLPRGAAFASRTFLASVGCFLPALKTPRNLLNAWPPWPSPCPTPRRPCFRKFAGRRRRRFRLGQSLASPALRVSPSRRSDLPCAELRDWTLRQRGRCCVGRTRRQSDPPTLALSRERNRTRPPARDDRFATSRGVAAGCCLRAKRSSALSGRLAGSRERIMRSRMVVLYRARPALACIIGARRACTVQMISSEEIPCR